MFWEWTLLLFSCINWPLTSFGKKSLFKLFLFNLIETSRNKEIELTTWTKKEHNLTKRLKRKFKKNKFKNQNNPPNYRKINNQFQNKPQEFHKMKKLLKKFMKLITNLNKKTKLANQPNFKENTLILTTYRHNS